MEITRAFQSRTATIAASGQLSGAVNCALYAFGGFEVPAAMTGTVVEFEVTADGANYKQLKDENDAVVTQAIVVGKCYPLPDDVFHFSGFKIKSQSAEAAERVFNIVLKG